jgi:N6-adenosine-specific RNA methylase IME4
MRRPPAKTPAQWAKQITEAWREGVRAIFAVGRLLAKAKDALEHGDWEDMCERRLPFTAGTASRLMAIAADERLSNPAHVPLLPPHWGTLYELTKLDNKEFKARIKDGTIRPDMERRDIAQIAKVNKRAEREHDLGQKQADLPKARYGVIVADPEWRFEPWSRHSGMDRAADNHYPTSCTEVIAARDVPSIAANDCVLFLWATAPMLPHALVVMAAWGFDYRSNYVWSKDKIGTGYWNRNAHEHLLVGVKGAIPAPAQGTQRPSLIEGRSTKHSAKPEVFLEMIEQYFPTLPKIELNRRGPARPGWHAWGNEAA